MTENCVNHLVIRLLKLLSARAGGQCVLTMVLTLAGVLVRTCSQLGRPDFASSNSGVWLDAQYLFTLGKSRLGKRRRAGFEEELEKRVKEFTRDNCTYCNDHYNLASISL